MNLDHTNHTHAEVFRLSGTLSAQRIEALIETADKVETLEGVEPHLQEAKGCFPGEDFLQEPIDELRALAKSMRKSDNKDELLRLIELLEEKQTEVAGQSEYGVSEINSALDLISE